MPVVVPAGVAAATISPGEQRGFASPVRVVVVVAIGEVTTMREFSGGVEPRMTCVGGDDALWCFH